MIPTWSNTVDCPDVFSDADSPGPIHMHKTGGWYLYDEVGCYELGSFETEAQAKEALEKYCTEVLG